MSSLLIEDNPVDARCWTNCWPNWHNPTLTFIVVAAHEEQNQLSAVLLVFGWRSIYGSLTGTAIDTEDTLTLIYAHDE